MLGGLLGALLSRLRGREFLPGGLPSLSLARSLEEERDLRAESCCLSLLGDQVVVEEWKRERRCFPFLRSSPCPAGLAPPFCSGSALLLDTVPPFWGSAVTVTEGECCSAATALAPSLGRLSSC